jgi:hypothetical protein
MLGFSSLLSFTFFFIGKERSKESYEEGVFGIDCFYNIYFREIYDLNNSLDISLKKFYNHFNFLVYI